MGRTSSAPISARGLFFPSFRDISAFFCVVCVLRSPTSQHSTTPLHPPHNHTFGQSPIPDPFLSPNSVLLSKAHSCSHMSTVGVLYLVRQKKRYFQLRLTFQPLTFCRTNFWLDNSLTVGRFSSLGLTSEWRKKWLCRAFQLGLKV